MARKSINKSRYLIAFGITLLIFIPGLLLGIVFDNARVVSLEKQNELQELDFKSLQLNYLYISTLSNGSDSCLALDAALEKSIADLSASLEKIEIYKKDVKLDDGSFDILSRKYLIDNLNYWLLSKKTKELCNLDTVNLLYFYNDDCDICPNQGVILTYFKQKLDKKFLVFPINADLASEELMVKVLMQSYNVTEFPSLVIDEDKFDGIISKEEMEGILCEKINKTVCEI